MASTQQRLAKNTINHYKPRMATTCFLHDPNANGPAMKGERLLPGIFYFGRLKNAPQKCPRPTSAFQDRWWCLAFELQPPSLGTHSSTNQWLTTHLDIQHTLKPTMKSECKCNNNFWKNAKISITSYMWTFIDIYCPPGHSRYISEHHGKGYERPESARNQWIEVPSCVLPRLPYRV